MHAAASGCSPLAPCAHANHLEQHRYKAGCLCHHVKRCATTLSKMHMTRDTRPGNMTRDTSACRFLSPQRSQPTTRTTMTSEDTARTTRLSTTRCGLPCSALRLQVSGTVCGCRPRCCQLLSTARRLRLRTKWPTAWCDTTQNMKSPQSDHDLIAVVK